MGADNEHIRKMMQQAETHNKFEDLGITEGIRTLARTTTQMGIDLAMAGATGGMSTETKVVDQVNVYQKGAAKITAEVVVRLRIDRIDRASDGRAVTVND